MLGCTAVATTALQDHGIGYYQSASEASGTSIAKERPPRRRPGTQQRHRDIIRHVAAKMLHPYQTFAVHSVYRKVRHSELECFLKKSLPII
eukprot:1496615-Pyramimonas_sp.AAC.1